MSVFADAELTYLAKGKLGLLATIDPAGLPHVVPLGWPYNPELDTIDIGGRDFARTRKFHNAQRNPDVALVIDDVPPWRPRCVLIRGMAEALADAPGPDGQQYWRDFDCLDRFAKDTGLPHLEPWRRFNRAVRASGDVGVWHETFKVRSSEYEAIYANMPVFGLAAAAGHLPAARKANTAAVRIGASTTDEPAVEPY